MIKVTLLGDSIRMIGYGLEMGCSHPKGNMWKIC